MTSSSRKGSEWLIADAYINYHEVIIDGLSDDLGPRITRKAKRHLEQMRRRLDTRFRRQPR